MGAIKILLRALLGGVSAIAGAGHTFWLTLTDESRALQI